MGPWYRSLTGQPDPSSPSSSSSSPTSASLLPLDAALLTGLEAKNKAALEKLDERLKHAHETEGETEISDALRARANYLTKIGDKVRLFRVVFWRVGAEGGV